MQIEDIYIETLFGAEIKAFPEQAMPRDEETVDRIFAGNLDGLPPLSSKVDFIFCQFFFGQVVRIFTSSTFTDMLMERNTLMEYVYPKIKEYCREKHGLEYQVWKF